MQSTVDPFPGASHDRLRREERIPLRCVFPGNVRIDQAQMAKEAWSSAFRMEMTGTKVPTFASPLIMSGRFCDGLPNRACPLFLEERAACSKWFDLHNAGEG